MSRVFSILVISLSVVLSTASISFANQLQFFEPESKAFSVQVPGKVKTARMREDSRLVLNYLWSNQAETEFIIEEGIEYKKKTFLNRFIAEYLRATYGKSFTLGQKSESKGKGWTGSQVSINKATGEESYSTIIPIRVLFAVSENDDLIYVLTAKPLPGSESINNDEVDRFFSTFQLNPLSASAEQRSKDMNSLGYSVGPLIFSLFLFGFVFTMFFVIGVIFYKLRKS